MWHVKERPGVELARGPGTIASPRASARQKMCSNKLYQIVLSGGSSYRRSILDTEAGAQSSSWPPSWCAALAEEEQPDTARWPRDLTGPRHPLGAYEANSASVSAHLRWHGRVQSRRSSPCNPDISSRQPSQRHLVHEAVRGFQVTVIDAGGVDEVETHQQVVEQSVDLCCSTSGPVMTRF